MDIERDEVSIVDSDAVLHYYVDSYSGVDYCYDVVEIDAAELAGTLPDSGVDDYQT